MVPLTPHNTPTKRLQQQTTRIRLEKNPNDKPPASEKQELTKRGSSQEVIVGAEGEEVVEGGDGGALEDRPVAAEEGYQHEQGCQAMQDQNPLDRHGRR